MLMRRVYERTFSGKGRSLAVQAVIAAAVPFFLAIVIALFVYQLMRDHAELSRQIERTSVSSRVSHQMLVNALDAETGVRGFVISGDESFLEPYRQAVDEHIETLARGRQVWPPGSHERELMDRFGGLFEEYRKEIAEPVIELKRQVMAGGDRSSESRARLEAIFSHGHDKALVDAMRRIIGNLSGVVQAQVAAQAQLSELRQRNAQLVAIVAAPLAVLSGILLVAAVIARTRKGLLRLASAAEQVAEGDYTQRVELSDSRELAHVSHGFNRMAERLARRSQQSGLLDRLTRALQGCQNSEEAFEMAEGYISRMLSNTRGAVALYRASRDHLSTVFTWPGDSEPEPEECIFDPDDCLSLRSGYTYEFCKRNGDPGCRHLPLRGAEAGLCIPMMDRGEVLGVLSVKPLDDAGFDQQTQQLATVLAETLSLSVGNLRLREALRNQSIRDSLTGLYNRRFLDETLERELSRSRRTSNRLSLIVFDIDHFKRFNDNWGHDAGDTVLRALANAMKDQAREMDLVCRLGGEGFIVVLPRTELGDALTIAERMREIAADLPLRHQGQLLERVTLSLGVACFPDHAESVEMLVKAADQALYRAKKAGRNRVEHA